VKILHLISTLDVGGAEQNLLRLVTSMDRGAFENEVVSLTAPGVIGKSIEKAGIPVHDLKMSKGMPDLRGILRLRFLAHLMNPDVIQCWLYHANLLGLFLLAPKKTLWSIRCSDMDLARYGAVYRWSVKAGAALSPLPIGIVINSNAGRAVHTGLGYRPRKWVTIPNGFDTTVFAPDNAAGQAVRSELGIPGDAFVIGHIARLDPMKDHETLFKAARLLLSSGAPAHFILAGRGMSSGNPALRPLIEGLDMRRIHLLDERGDIPRLLNALDLATSSSVSEGLPNAVGEAMAAGVPCVATDAGDSAELVGNTGIVVPRSDPAVLASAWKKLMDAGANHRRELGALARKRITDHYGLPSMTAAYEALYRSLA
jgi:glycosyltransferase involved in cell wall biosynthesis